MLSTRIGRLIHLVLGCALILGALAFMRLRRADVEEIAPKVNPEQVSEIYGQRVRATRSLLVGSNVNM